MSQPIIHYPHSQHRSERCWNQDYRQIVSIDPGRRHFALRIERRYNNSRIDTLVWDLIDLTSTSEHTIYENLTRALDKYSYYYSQCHTVIIESQLMINRTDILRLMQHTISYFCFFLRDHALLPSIVELPSKLKTKQLGCIKNRDIKVWSILRAREYLEERQDEFGSSVLESQRKKDDLADTLIQIEGYLAWLDQEQQSLEKA